MSDKRTVADRIRHLGPCGEATIEQLREARRAAACVAAAYVADAAARARVQAQCADIVRQH